MIIIYTISIMIMTVVIVIIIVAIIMMITLRIVIIMTISHNDDKDEHIIPNKVHHISLLVHLYPRDQVSPGPPR